MSDEQPMPLSLEVLKAALILQRRIRTRRFDAAPPQGALHALASLIHHRMSAFAVAIGCKADMSWCSANVRFDPKRTSFTPFRVEVPIGRMPCS